MKKINFESYVAKDAIFLAKAQIKWFGVFVTHFKGCIVVTTISLLTPDSPHNSYYHNSFDAMNEFIRILSALVN